MPLKLGLLVNPVAGLGGTVALKGSDGTDVQAAAVARGARARAPERTVRMLRAFQQAADVRWFTWGGAMGADALAAAGLACEVLGNPGAISTAEDTRLAAGSMVSAGVDLLLFAGGDGTARDLLEAIDQQLPVLGIPGGVKMHSGVFATTPERAAELLDALVSGGLVSSVTREVRDLDESALHHGEIRPRYFGEMKVPEPGGYLQHTKERGVENESLAVTEIAAEMAEQLAEETRPVVLGLGSTLGEIKHALGFEGSVLGFDVWQQGRVLARDVDARWLEAELTDAIVVLSFTRGQGFLIGRGNQQLTPAFLRRLGRDAIRVVGTRTKLTSLDGRPLLIDSDDPALDRAWSGLIEVITGYQDRLFYRLSDHE
ncbi:MAG: ATP-NAD kinase family protein [Pseudomonadales bacterium]